MNPRPIVIYEKPPPPPTFLYACPNCGWAATSHDPNRPVGCPRCGAPVAVKDHR